MTESRLRRCPSCGRYTLHADCPDGHGPTRSPHPARFDATDRYGVYRRRLLEAVRAEGGPA